ncbi:hypothetical protein [Edwardsiella tarda]|uniref:hypothetical protein n=1 Tax=Edwardsiella tarda TaxID=636 RepID=UPI00083A2B01|nr:hypothetical protein [Edwardsiella tarda]
MVYVINRYGVESPAEAAVRNRLERDLKEIDKQLKSPHLSDKLKKELIDDRDSTVRKLVNIGKTMEVIPLNIEKDD